MTRNFPAQSANDLWKERYDNWFWGSIIVVVFIHLGFFTLFPAFSTEDVSFSSDDLVAVEIPPPEVDIPPPPEAISRPATPIISDVNIDENITISPTTFEENPVSDLPPPPEKSGEGEIDLSKGPTFTPFTVGPSILNRDEVIQTMRREYPPLLRDAGIGGTVVVYFFIDSIGVVKDYRIEESSGHTQLDEAALRVADKYRFSPALNRDKKVAVWVKFPIVFRIR